MNEKERDHERSLVRLLVFRWLLLAALLASAAFFIAAWLR
jgi:hypothetical protein